MAAEGKLIQPNEERPANKLATLNPNELATTQQAAQAMAFEQISFKVAIERPRDMDIVRQRLLRDCERPSFAGGAIYRKPIGGTTAQGLSIRFMEAALSAMGNIHIKRFVTLDDDLRRKIMIVVTDLEANIRIESEIVIEKTVERKSLKEGQNPRGSRLNSKGERVYLVEATEDDLLTKESAIASKFIRQNAGRLVPGWLQEECEQEIRATMEKKIKEDPDHEKNKVIDAFDTIGVRVSDLKAFLGLPSLDTLVPKDLMTLREVFQAIKDGETNWREVMEQRDSARGTPAPAEGEKPKSRTEAVKAAIAQKSPEAAAAITTAAEISAPDIGRQNAQEAPQSTQEPSGGTDPLEEPAAASQPEPASAAPVAESKPEPKPSGAGATSESQTAYGMTLTHVQEKGTTKGGKFLYCEFNYERNGKKHKFYANNWHRSLFAVLQGGLDKVFDLSCHEEGDPPKFIVDDVLTCNGAEYEGGKEKTF